MQFIGFIATCLIVATTGCTFWQNNPQLEKDVEMLAEDAGKAALETLKSPSPSPVPKAQ